jgi:hypothetical protein
MVSAVQKAWLKPVSNRNSAIKNAFQGFFLGFLQTMRTFGDLIFNTLTMKRLSVYLLLLFSITSISLSAQDSTTVSGKLMSFAKKAAKFNLDFTQEKVYLHFDNTGYFLGETIWFKAYVVKAQNNRETDMSRTLYVDLLSPEGYVIENKKLKIEDGACRGEFLLPDSLKAGFYEVRAYTRCMMNFGSEVIFSRVFPVFDEPKTEGDYADRNMTYRKFTIPVLREKEPKRDKINVSFYPEGGSLIAGMESKVAFKATDKQGKSIAVTGSVYNSKGDEIAAITTQHDGMGAFSLFSDGKKCTAKVVYDGKESKFDLPKADTSGYIMTAFNLSAKSLRVMIQKSPQLSEKDSLALVLMCRGQILDFRTVAIKDEGTMFSFKKSNLPDGVCQLTLYDTEGHIRCERLLFMQPTLNTNLQVKTDKTSYKPYEKIGLTLQAHDEDGNPVKGMVSLAVRDGVNSDFGNSDNSNIATNLLLSSDLKGYIENPTWYFAESTTERLLGLDLLMLTQGWRRYSWKRMEGLEPFTAKHPIEEGILIDGKVLSLIAKKEKSNIDVLFWMLKGDQSYKGECKTDENGNFNFLLDMYGVWDLNLQTKNEDKRKEYRILLNRIFAPEARSYTGFDNEIWLDNTLKTPEPIPDSTALLLGEIKYTTETTPTNPEGYKEYTIKEVVKTAKRPLTMMQQAVRKASLGYDVGKITDAHRDIGVSEAPDILHMLQEENPYFSIIYKENDSAEYRYKGRPVHFLFNGTPSEYAQTRKIEELQGDEVEKLLIVEDREITRYYYPQDEKDPVIVMITFFKNGFQRKEPIGIRKTTFQGYSESKEFYSPYYHPGIPVLDPDYRRTLYWNPDVVLQENGKASLEFYNNVGCKKLIISAEGLTSDGMILVDEHQQ